MERLRRQLGLTTIALVALVGLDGCLSKAITKQAAGDIVRTSAAFTRPKFAHIPRLLTFQGYYYSEYGSEGVLSITDIARVDPTLAILKLERVISINESIYGPGRGALHQLVINPTGIDASLLMADEDARSGAYDQQEELDAQEERRRGTSLVSYNSFKKEIGWRVPIGTREFLQVDQIHNYRDANENIPVNELAIDFSWRWVPNELGDAFDTESATFHSFPDEVQRQAGVWGARMNTSAPMHSRAYLQREGKEWVLRLIQWSLGQGNPR
jgi:hypothetical protein